MQRKAIAAGALILASIPLVASSAQAKVDAAPAAIQVDPIAEFSDRLEEMYGPNTRPLRADTLQAVAAVLPQLGNLSTETLSLFTKIDDLEEALGMNAWDIIRQNAYASFTPTPAEVQAFKDDLNPIFKDSSSTPPIPQWLLDAYSVSMGSSSGPAQGGLSPYKPVWWYIKWLYEQHKKAQEYKKMCNKRFQAYENYWRKHCEDQGCTFRNTGGDGDTFCFWCDCEEPEPLDSFGLVPEAHPSAPWKSNPGDFASPFGKCLGKNALCGAN